MRKRTLGSVLATALAAGTLAVGQAHAETAPPLPETAPSAVHAGGQKVTLITGDVVALVGQEVVVDPRERTPFVRLTRNKDQYVIPVDAVGLVAEGRLDRELFNISGLVRQRYDDARTDSVPLLVQEPRGLASARTERSFGDFNLAAVSTPKKDAKQSWREIADTGRKIWLNARLSASLDVSVPQVGAPAAWQAGQTGKGVTVAVLDSGIDADHPDLAGKVALAKDFTGLGTVEDRNGHGTHVAATIAGNNAKYRGVAPDAALAVGKVLDDEGQGQLDDIIEGMRWAAVEAKAKIVNLSLGGAPSDGNDPVSTVLNELSRKYGTLFVVASGNQGTAESVSAPASADAALAVGSVTKSGVVSEFSSRGPRVGDAALKPEITAPGSDITAAQAGGTGYVAMSGTSMAAPHVAGAAALLAGQHQDWTGQDIKASLVSTASPVAAHAFAVGSGQVDVGRAVASTVRVHPASVSANLKWPDRKAQKKTVTYRNSGATALALSLTTELTDTSGQAAPAALAKLSASAVTVPAGGQANVTVTFTPRSGRPGKYGGALLASTSDGNVLRTPMAVQDEPESYNLTTTVLDQDGRTPENTYVYVVDHVHADMVAVRPGEPLRLLAGRYSVITQVYTASRGTTSALSHPEVDLKRDTVIGLDARQAKRVSVRTDQPTVRAGNWQWLLEVEPAGTPNRFGLVNPFLEPRFDEFYAYSTPGVSSTAFRYVDIFRLEQPSLELFAETPQRYEVAAYWWRTQPPDGTGRTHLVHGGAGTPEDLAKIVAKDKMVVLDLRDDLANEEIDRRIADVEATGAASIAINAVSSKPGSKIAAKTRTASLFPVVYLHPRYGPQFSELAKRGGEATLTARTGGKHRYELVFASPGKVPDNLAYSVRTADLAAVSTKYHGYNEEVPPRIGGASGGDSLSVYTPTRPASERVEHFTPGNWRLSVSSALDSGYVRKLELAAGKSYAVEWNRAVLAPAFTGTTTDELGEHPWAYRNNQLIDVTVPFFSDAAGHAGVPDMMDGTATGVTSLYRGEQLLATQHLPGRGTFWVSQQDSTFRLTTEVKRETSWWPTSTKINADWTFTAPFRQGRRTALPLLTARVEPPVDLTNTAPGGRAVTFPVTVTREDGPATIRSLSVEVSYDDGQTWHTATVSDGKVTLTHPANGFATLRVKAADSDGNTVTETITRAYRIG